MCLSIVQAHFYNLHDMLLNLHEFAFQGQNHDEIKREHVTAFYIVRRAWLWLELFASTVGSSLYYHGYHICSRTIFFGDAVALLRESYTFV